MIRRKKCAFTCYVFYLPIYIPQIFRSVETKLVRVN